MFQCFLQQRSTFSTPRWLPALNNISSGSRGLLRLAEFKATTPASAIVKGPGLRSGSYFKTEFARHGIVRQRDLQLLRNLKNHGILIAASKDHARNQIHDLYFSGDSIYGNANAEAMMRRYLREHRVKPLWRITAVIWAGRPIVKGMFRKRVLAAWQQALQNRGYDSEGRNLAKGWELFGTVEIKTHEPLVALYTPFESLRNWFELVIKVLEPELGRRAGGDAVARADRDLGTQAWQARQTQPSQRRQDGRPAYRDQYDHGDNRPPYASQRASPQDRREAFRYLNGPDGNRPPYSSQRTTPTARGQYGKGRHSPGGFERPRTTGPWRPDK